MPEVLEFRDNGSLHDDIFLSLPGIERRADAYYFALDRLEDEEEDGDHSPAKIRRVFVELLNQWHAAVGSLEERRHIFLPYDFSDQYTRCLRCSRNGGMLSVVDGWSDHEGWKTQPSALGDYLTTLDHFDSGDSPTFIVSVQDFLLRIEAAMKKALPTA